MKLNFEGSPLAPIELPPGVTGFGSAELAYLLARHEGGTIARSRELLGVDREAATDPPSFYAQHVRAGASSLLARGLIRVDEGALVPTAEAAVLEYAASESRRWTRVAVAGESELDIGLVLQAPLMTVVMQSRSLGTWFAGFDEVQTPPSELVLRFIEMLQESRPRSAFWVTTWTLNAGPEMLFLGFDDTQARWAVLDGSTSPADERPELLDRTAVLSELAALVPGAEVAPDGDTA